MKQPEIRQKGVQFGYGVLKFLLLRSQNIQLFLVKLG